MQNPYVISTIHPKLKSLLTVFVVVVFGHDDITNGQQTHRESEKKPIKLVILYKKQFQNGNANIKKHCFQQLSNNIVFQLQN